MKIAITGAAGGLGRHITSVLGERHDLMLIDNVDPAEATVFDGRSPTGRHAQPFIPEWPYHRVDISSPDDLEVAFRGAEVVVHLAGWPGGSWDDVRSTMHTNVMGTLGVYEAVRAAGVRRVLNASSINAFGSIYWRVQPSAPIRSRLPLIEDDRRVPEDPYSLSKGITEDIGWTYRRAFGIEAVNLRFAAVVPASSYERTLAAGLKRSTRWESDLWGWVHIDDWSQGMVAAVQAHDPTSEPMVIGAADTRAPESTMALIRAYKPEFIHELREPLPGRAPLLSITRARSVLGYSPRHTFDEAPVVDS